MSSFTKFALDQNILKVLEEIGYEKPTPIQESVIPKVFEGVDIIASAQTGTGKTAAFMLPILHSLMQPGFKTHEGPQVLVLVPTRELAIQVADEAKRFSKYLAKTKTVCIYGGVPYPVQKRMLASRYEILVATPGRLLDHMEQGRIDLSHLKMIVLDEADRMLDMGFIHDVEHIMKQTPSGKQTLLFSATMGKRILPFSQKLQKNPFAIDIEASIASTSNIEQRLYYVDNISHKLRLLEHILENSQIGQAIIFTSTKHQAGELAYYLEEKGYKSEALHGDMNQRQRSRTIGKLRQGSFQFLIATDVAARGIDIPSLSHVINFDLPFAAEDFVHRIGRTGRAGASGIAMTFATYKEDFRVLKINKLLTKPIEVHVIEGLEPSGKQQQDRRKPPRRSNNERPYGRSGASQGNHGSRHKKMMPQPASKPGKRSRSPSSWKKDSR